MAIFPLFFTSYLVLSSVQTVIMIDVQEPLCQILPILKLITPIKILLANNVTVNEESRDIYIPGKTELIFTCISSFPVDLDIDAHLMNQDLSIETTRQFSPGSSSGYCFSISVHINTTRESTGKYSCRNTQNFKYNSTYYLFSNGENPPFLLHGDIGHDIIKVKPSSKNTVAILPCVTTNPNISVALYKIEFKDFHLLTLGDHLLYNPRIGFSLHLAKFPDPYGKYKCVASNSDYFDVFVQILEPDDENNAVDAPIVSINTETDFGKPNFICNSTDQVSLASSLNCRNSIECMAMEKCLYHDLRCSEPQFCKCLYRGHSCSKSYRVQKNITGDGCSLVPYNANGGIVHCTSKNDSNQSFSKVIKYFRGLSGNIVTDWTLAKIDDILRVSTVFNHSDTIYYVGEEITFLCIGSRFVFSKRFLWGFKLRNGTYMYPNITDATTSATNNGAVLREEVKIVISDPNIIQVICIAPVWNETLSMNATESLVVKDSMPPIFFDPTNVTLSVGVNELAHTLRCEAIGFPHPDILWLRNGQEFLTDFHFDNSVENVTKSMIMLKDVSLSDDGFIYTCNASNPRGMIFKTFTVTVYQPPTLLVFSLTSSLGIFCLIVILIIFYTIWRRLQLQNRGYTFHFSRLDVDEFENGNPEAVKKCSDEYEKALYLPYDKKMEIQPEHLITDYNNILGQGEFGVVLKGKLVCSTTEPFPVAVKTTKDSNTNHLKALLSELKIRIYIGNHENVVNLLGAVTKHIADRNVSVVFEYCQLGSMEKYLRSRRNTFLNEFAPDGSRLCSKAPSGNYVKIEYLVKTSDLILWAYQIANGMEYLSAKKVIHGDLAARNILVTENHTVKITDFGLSKHLYNYTSNYVTKKNDTPMPWRWLSLEALRDQSFSVHSDIWAYGITLWELFSLAETPYPSVVFNEDFINNLIAGQRLGKPKYSNFEIYRIMKECWRGETKERPSFSALKYSFHQLLPSENYTESETDSENHSGEFSGVCESKDCLLPDSTSVQQQVQLKKHYRVRKENKDLSHSLLSLNL